MSERKPKRTAIEKDKTHEAKEDIVTIAGQDSFPASDPPPWTLGREPGNKKNAL